MSNTLPLSRQQLLPSIVLGLSCGVGFFIAQESWKRKQWSWSTVSNITRKLVDTDVPWWLLAVGPTGWYPLAFWWVLKDIMAEDGEKKEENAENQAEIDQVRPDSTAREISAPQSIELPPPPPILLQHVASDLKSTSSSQQPQRHLEMLVHNIAHTDLVLSLDPQEDPQDGGEQYCLCRPRFSAFDLYTRRILKSLPSNPETVSFPRYERSDEDPRHTIVTPRPSRQKQMPTGFQLDPDNPILKVPSEELQNFRVRGRDVPRIEQYTRDNMDEQSNIRLDYVFFPLLAALIPRWYQQIATNYSPKTDVKKVLILVSGVGTPRNWTHSVAGNSTEACSALMERFINILHPEVTVVRIHSKTNLFRYDENILFANRELRPRIDAYRDAHAQRRAYPDEIKYPKDLMDAPFSEDWKRSFHVSISYAGGSPARIHAIQAALRPYRPNYMHFWQLKSFWHDTKIVDDDIEMHSFEEMETVPAFEASNVADSNTRLVIQEMKAFRQEFLELLEGRNDVEEFWLRKSKKPVLAVLLVKSPNQAEPILYRGTNMEVSMPTGSLCAERNVIGTALASNPGLKREDLKMVAVLAVPLPLPIETIDVRPENMSRNMSFASYSSIVNEDDEEGEDWVIPGGDITGEQPNTSLDTSMACEVIEHISREPLRLPSAHPSSTATPPGTPIRRIALYTNARATTSNTGSKPAYHAVGGRKQKRTVLVHSDKDLNPLRPCGACNEWLKKISESNPYFSVITFTDAECAGVYVTPCQE
jgi:cytidine deaminase